MTTPATRRNIKLWMEMVNTTRHIQTDLREKLRTNFEWTLPKFQVIAMLSNHSDGIRLSALSASLLLSNANVSVMIERMVQDKMVDRITDKQDRRAVILRLTQNGNAEFSKIMIEYQKWIGAHFGKLDEKEAKQLFTIFETLNINTHR